MEFVEQKQASFGGDPAALLAEVCPTVACELPKADDPALTDKLRCFQQYMSMDLGSACTQALKSTLTPLIRVAAQPKISAAEQRALDKYKVLAAQCPEINCPMPASQAEMMATLQCVKRVPVSSLSAACKSAMGIRTASSEGHGHDHGPGSDHDGHDHGSHPGMTHAQYMAQQMAAQQAAHDHGPGSDHDGHDHNAMAGMSHAQYLAQQRAAAAARAAQQSGHDHGPGSDHSGHDHGR